MGECRGIEDNATRLACYDGVAQRATVMPAADRSTPQAPKPQDEPTSPMQQAWDLKPGAGENFLIRPYRSVYLLPAFTTSRVNSAPSSPGRGVANTAGIEATEAKFQLSFKTRLASGILGDNGDIWAAYTQSSRWQVYSADISRPFRETNYEPEIMFLWKTQQKWLGFDVRYASLGLSHQSNGRANPLSRSWNRAIGQLGLERDDLALTLRAWKRLPEQTSADDNSDIQKYLGSGEVEISKKFGQHFFVARLHRPISPGGDAKGSLRIEYAFPISGRLRGHAQYFTGYGESLIDYNHKANYLGLGISLIELY